MAETPEGKVREASLIFLFSSRHKQLCMPYMQYINIHKAMTKTETLSIRVDMDTKEKAETISAMQEARLLAKDPDAKTYADADALFADIL